jgi:hypothetical protein
MQHILIGGWQIFNLPPRPNWKPKLKTKVGLRLSIYTHYN